MHVKAPEVKILLYLYFWGVLHFQEPVKSQEIWVVSPAVQETRPPAPPFTTLVFIFSGVQY